MLRCAMAELAKERGGREFIPADALKHLKALYYGSSPEELPRLPYIDQPHESVRFAAVSLGDPSAAPQILDIQAVDLGAMPSTVFWSVIGGSGSSARVSRQVERLCRLSQVINMKGHLSLFRERVAARPARTRVRLVRR